MKLLWKRLHPHAVAPTYAHVSDAGADLTLVEGARLWPLQRKDLPVGIAVEPPLGYFYDIRPRSSTLRKRGLLVHQGTIDNGFRGPLFVYVMNLRPWPVTVRPGDRLAQIVMLRSTQPVVEEVEELSETPRGAGGFGSTGLR